MTPARTVLESLAAACEGLIVTSESDSDVTPLVVEAPGKGELTPALVLALLGRDPTADVEATTVGAFLGPLGRPRPWHDAAEKEMASRFRRLRRLLERRFDGATVYRIGRRSIDVVILGRAEDGRLAGVRTRVVET